MLHGDMAPWQNDRDLEMACWESMRLCIMPNKSMNFGGACVLEFDKGKCAGVQVKG